MAKNEVRLRLDGAPEHRGHVLAHALVQKIDRFLKTFGRFERAYLGQRVRQTDFEVTLLSHHSPAEVGLNPIPRVPSYIPEPVVEWTLSQWEKISRGEKPDSLVDDDLVDDVVQLGSRPDDAEFREFVISYAHHRIEFDDRAEANALALRAELVSSRAGLPWRRGLSLGSLTGELRSVIDASHERQIVICPPLGQEQILCIFPEEVREKIKEYLFSFVRVTGRLHYNEKSPIPSLIEIDRIEPLTGGESRPHMLDGFGLFRDSYYSVTDNIDQ
jgi:hypothetical protein